MNGKTLQRLLPVLAFVFLASGCGDAGGEISGEPIRLIVRGDDMGMTHAANEAVELSFEKGILTAVGVIVPSPWFEEAARMCREHPEWSVGVHLSVNGEWRDYKWRPFLPRTEVPSLVDEDGYLYPTAQAFLDARPEPEEIEKELRAQLEFALKKNIDVQYIDTHMDTLERDPEFVAIVEQIAADYKLPISAKCGEDTDFMNIYNVPPERKEAVLAAKLKTLAPGLWLLVVHPGLDTSEERAIRDTNPEGLPHVAAHRHAEVRALMSPWIQRIVRRRGIELVGYKPFRAKLRSSGLSPIP